MFERFINNEICRKLFFWLLDHSTGDYDAAIIAYDCQITDITQFTGYIYVFDQLGILSVDESSDDLRVIFNEDSLIVESFRNLRETFDNEAYRNSQVCAAFVSLESGVLQNTGNELVNYFQDLTDEERVDFYNLITDYKNFEVSSDPVLGTAQESLIEQLKQLDEEGLLEKFIEYVKRNLYI